MPDSTQQKVVYGKRKKAWRLVDSNTLPKRRQAFKKIGSFSLIERVILSAGAMLIFSVSFQIDQMPEGKENGQLIKYIG